MKKHLLATSGALAVCGLQLLNGVGVYAAGTTSVSTFSELGTCLAVTNNTCQLASNITATDNITIASGIKSTLDLGNYSLNNGSSNQYSIIIQGELTVTGGSNGKTSEAFSVEEGGTLNIKSGTFGSAIGADNATTKKTINIEGGTFNDFIAAGTKSTLTIKNGVFDKFVSSEGVLNIDGGTFNGPVQARADSTATISNGVFNDYVMIEGESENKITGGKFNDTLFPSSENTKLTITGGEFNFINSSVYYDGSSLTISGGKFNTGFDINVKTLTITGGTFYNGKDVADWMALILEQPDVQKYSITGGTFLNTKDEYGNLIAVKTITPPTESSIKSIFAGGNVLDGTWIDLDSDGGASTGYWSSIKKVLSDVDIVVPSTSGVTAPDTGAFTSDNQNAIAIATATTLVASGIIFCLVTYLKKRLNGGVHFNR